MTEPPKKKWSEPEQSPSAQKIWNTGGGLLYTIEEKKVDPGLSNSPIYGVLELKWDEGRDIEQLESFILGLATQKALHDIDLRIEYKGDFDLERSVREGKNSCRILFTQPHNADRPTIDQMFDAFHQIGLVNDPKAWKIIKEESPGFPRQ